MNQQFSHNPVLLKESIEYMDVLAGNRIIDCTLGLGGHASAFLDSVDGNAELIGIDTDLKNLDDAKVRINNEKATYIHANFREIPSLELGTFDVIFADLGVSSPHFDDAERGFSFRRDGPLDMRLDRSKGQTAAQLIVDVSEERLADILFHYGEIRQSRKLATLLKQAAPQTTTELSAVCEELFGFRTKSFLPQVFQALRIAVNDELGALEDLLTFAPDMLNAGGRLGIISFHSLEDRMVKQAFRKLCMAEKDEHTGQDLYEPPFKELSRKAIKPSDTEIEQNPRARSARLRVIQKQ